MYRPRKQLNNALWMNVCSYCLQQALDMADRLTSDASGALPAAQAQQSPATGQAARTQRYTQAVDNSQSVVDND